jgi:hypothetical protein
MCLLARPVSERGVVRTSRAIRRLFTELPQPGRTFFWRFIALFLVALLLGAVTQMRWVGLGISGAGVFLFLFRWHVFRDINGTASMWSRIYKEPWNQTWRVYVCRCPYDQSHGFMYMLIGTFFVASGLGISCS